MRKLIYPLSFLTLFIFTFLSGQTVTSNILLGQTISFDSKILNETREVMVYTPEGYQQSEISYPVLYVLDGESKFFLSAAISNFLARNQNIPKLIVVAIPNTARNRDFTPETSRQNKNYGGADQFTEFLESEVMKHINSAYRTNDFNILFGHSLTAMYSIYTLFSNPSLFDAHIAASPYLMYEDGFVIKKVEEALSNSPELNNKLFISIGDEPEYFESLERTTKLFESIEAGLEWSLEKYTDENHMSTPLKTITDGLEFVFSDWPLTLEVAQNGVKAIKEHYKNIKSKYGIDRQPDEASLNRIGYELLQAGNIKKAIEVFKYNVALYPNSANVYDSLGDGYDAADETKKALKNYRMAVSIAENTGNANLGVYKKNVKRLEEKK